jgi:hypothetical protein
VVVAPASWHRVFVVALLIVPLLVVLVLMSPTWLAWPLLSKDRRDALVQVLETYLNWIKVVAG